MRRDPRRLAEEDEPFPLRATGIVLTIWVVGLLLIAFVVVPALFATCIPTAPAGPPGG